MQNKAFSMEDLFAFLNAGVSAFHSTAAAAAILEAEGYRNCPESAAWHLVPGGKYYTTRNGSAILAWRMPKGTLTGWHAAASHSDSPTWRIKTLDGADHGFARAEVEGYGGMLMSTWFDRPLSVAGRLLVRTADGVESRLVHPERALACIPNLCIHFNREANTGLNYNPQVDLQPIFGAEGGSLKDTLAAEAGGKAEDILATDLVLCITEKAQRVGLQGEYFMSGRIDDLECAYATLYGFLQGRGEEAGRGDIWVMFDNEEVGSSSRQGAQGSLMSDVLARIEESLGVTKEQSIRARTNCLLLSADNGHAIHPNHPEKSDQKLPVNMGGGVILKYNARQTYTTSGLTGAAFTAICEKAGVPVQTFANRADVAGGSTLGNLLGRQILMPMVDIGVGQLAMHSAMETASCKDAEYLANACAAYYCIWAIWPAACWPGSVPKARAAASCCASRIWTPSAARAFTRTCWSRTLHGWVLCGTRAAAPAAPTGLTTRANARTSTPGSTKSWKRRALCTPASVPAPSCTRPVRPTPRTATSSIPAPAGT